MRRREETIRGIVSPPNDAADAEAICEAVTRPTMRVTPEACLRHDTIRAHLSEFGPSGPWLGRNAPPERFVRAGPHPSSSVVAKGIHNIARLLTAADQLPATAQAAVEMLAEQLRESLLQNYPSIFMPLRDDV